MSTDRTPAVEPHANAQNEINDLPAPDNAAEKVKGGFGPIDSKTTPPPFGPIDGKTPKVGPIDA